MLAIAPCIDASPRCLPTTSHAAVACCKRTARVEKKLRIRGTPTTIGDQSSNCVIDPALRASMPPAMVRRLCHKHALLRTRACAAALVCKNAPVTGVNASSATWEEARAECLVHGRSLCSVEQLEGGIGCSFSRGAHDLVWTNTPAECNHSAAVLRDEYQPLSDPGTCTDAHQPLTIGNTSSTASLAECLRRCDAADPLQASTSHCESVRYNHHTHECAVMRHCRERYSLSVGQCSRWWLLRPYDAMVMRKLVPSQDPKKSSASAHCYFTRGSTKTDGTAIRRRRRNKLVWKDSEAERAEMVRRRPKSSVCSATPLPASQPGAVINATYNKAWRYYTSLDCGADAATPRICLLFKKMGKAALLGGLNSTDGFTFGAVSTMLRLDEPWTEGMFTHNVAILRDGAGPQSYAMMGGMQGFVSNATCRFLHCPKRAGQCHSSRSACLQLEPSTGIRLSRGIGLPWSPLSWSQPTTVLSGAQPAGCVDRRPRYTGFPRVLACEFDGRLSLVRHGAEYLLYARANLQFGALAGGRFVQVSRSSRLDGGWATWQPVQIAGVDPTKIDVYTFAVQSNPVDPSTLLAIFPLAEPPWACVSFAVSRDGVTFSRPVTLANGHLGVRVNEDGVREWRGEDHPVAGVVRAPGATGKIVFYIHHAVKGVTTREGAVPHVRSYTLDAAELARQTAMGLSRL